ncbi:MAG: hypothetical protein CL916_11075 [Deltaproteobacteria bacterium]|nr:hypothetical protein [Deltaproteobacteria bacterium]
MDCDTDTKTSLSSIILMIFFLTWFACSQETKTNTQNNTAKKTPLITNQKGNPPQGNNRFQPGKHPPNKGQHLPPKGGFLPSSTPAEDLSSSWSDRFTSVNVPTQSIQKFCRDDDGDGFVRAEDCPLESPAKVDCDDNDPSVTPKTEIWIPPGPFIMGSISSHAGSDEDPVHTIFLNGYCLDRTEVSAGEWFQWLQKEQRIPQGSDVRNMKDGNLEVGRAEYPAEGVTWIEARDYCTAQGKTLPTEAQWEKAARGGCELGSDSSVCDKKDLRPYPWGFDEPTCERANHQLSTKGMPKLCVSDTKKVDSLPNGSGPYGHLHLSGNVWEFVLDAWHPETYNTERPQDPTGPSQGNIHVLRGGSWNTFSTNMRAANRFHDLVMGSASGFRCARTFGSGVQDTVAPLEMVTLSGTIYGAPMLKGRAMYVTAFDASDADPNGMLAPGRSPVAETRLVPNNQKQQSFSISVPKNYSYILSAALDAGTGANKDNYISASGSGGFGQAKQNPISAPKDTSKITITLMAPPK